MLTAMVNICYNAGKIDLSRYHAMLHEIDQRYNHTRLDGVRNEPQHDVAQGKPEVLPRQRIANLSDANKHKP